jgi:hypothetical protein
MSSIWRYLKRQSAVTLITSVLKTGEGAANFIMIKGASFFTSHSLWPPRVGLPCFSLTKASPSARQHVAWAAVDFTQTLYIKALSREKLPPASKEAAARRKETKKTKNHHSRSNFDTFALTGIESATGCQ